MSYYKKIPIMGKAVATAEQMAAYLLIVNPNPKINMPILDFCKLYLAIGAQEGVRGDLLFAQTCKETGYLAFTGVVKPQQNNFAGLGSTDNKTEGAWFEDEATGILAQAQHAKGYFGEPLSCDCVDPRYSLLVKYGKIGTAKHWEDLGGKWAVPGYDTKKYSSLEEANLACDSYGYQIVKIFDAFLLDTFVPDTPMKNKVVALDAGHGLKTAGKQTPDGIKEWTLNDKVRDKVVEMLSGYNVTFIFPDNDEGNIDEGLASRRTMYVNRKVDAAVSIHHNAFTGSWNNATGVEVFTDRNETTSDTSLANAIYKRLPKYTGLVGRGIKEANFAVINQNSVPAVLVEGGFMDSNIDYKVITSDAGQTAYAKAIAEGLIEFLGLVKTTPQTKPEVSDDNCEITMPVIKRGSKGKAVGIWQVIIGAEVDEDFGPDTEKKTIEFQKKAFPNNDDEWDGVAGENSWKAGFKTIK